MRSVFGLYDSTGSYNVRYVAWSDVVRSPGTVRVDLTEVMQSAFYIF